MAKDRIKNYAQGTSEINILKDIRTDLSVTPSSYTPDATVVTKDRVVTFAQAEEELVVLSDIGKGVKQQVVKGDIADKRITNIEKLLQGNLYDYQTDSTSAYTKSVPAGAMPYAGLESVGGKTVVWNQLCDSSTYRADGTVSNGITFTHITNGIRMTGVVETANNNWVVLRNNIVAGHKYLVTGTPTIGLNLRVNYSGTFTNVYPNFIFTGVNSNAYIAFQTSAGSEIDITWNPQIFDLTLMFGSGNEPSTVAEFESMFPADFYAYNAGTLLSAGVTEVKSDSKNLLDQDAFLGAVPNATKGDGYWDVNTYQIATKYPNNYANNPCAVFTQSTLTLSCEIKRKNVGHITFFMRLLKADGTNEYKRFDLDDENWHKGSITITGNTEGVKIGFSWNENKNIFIRNMQVEANSVVTDYSPYGTIQTVTIPASIQALEGYGWSAGTVYNYIDYERKVFVKLVDQKTFDGSDDENWTLAGATLRNAFMSNTILELTKYPMPLINNRGILVNSGGSASTDDQNIITCRACDVGFTNNFYIFAPPSDISDVTALKAWLSANPLTVCYEMSTPIETDISQYLTDDNLINVEAGGTLTFPNSNGDDYRLPVPSEETYMIDLQEAINNG